VCFVRIQADPPWLSCPSSSLVQGRHERSYRVRDKRLCELLFPSRKAASELVGQGSSNLHVSDTSGRSQQQNQTWPDAPSIAWEWELLMVCTSTIRAGRSRHCFRSVRGRWLHFQDLHSITCLILRPLEDSRPLSRAERSASEISRAYLMSVAAPRYQYVGHYPKLPFALRPNRSGRTWHDLSHSERERHGPSHSEREPHGPSRYGRERHGPSRYGRERPGPLKTGAFCLLRIWMLPKLCRPLQWTCLASS